MHETCLTHTYVWYMFDPYVWDNCLNICMYKTCLTHYVCMRHMFWFIFKFYIHLHIMCDMIPVNTYMCIYFILLNLFMNQNCSGLALLHACICGWDIMTMLQCDLFHAKGEVLFFSCSFGVWAAEKVLHVKMHHYLNLMFWGFCRVLFEMFKENISFWIGYSFWKCTAIDFTCSF